MSRIVLALTPYRSASLALGLRSLELEFWFRNSGSSSSQAALCMKISAAFLLSSTTFAAFSLGALSFSIGLKLIVETIQQLLPN
mmetsp:Transcript_68355/g.182372  ORF Transcript_68355/g.182372 Transcript_68355/m.182372 type:complete len:84 (-) Transcript_68355:190-441(-)